MRWREHGLQGDRCGVDEGVAGRGVTEERGNLQCDVSRSRWVYGMRVLRRATDGAPPSSSTTTIAGSASHTMNAWTPQEAGLREILQTIHESTDTQNIAVQRNITHVPSFPLHLHFIHRSQSPRLSSRSIETQQLYACARLHRISCLHPFFVTPGTGQNQDHRRLPPQE